MTYIKGQRPTWNEYFMMMAKLAATRSTCLAFPVGAVIVKDKRVLSTGYNGPPANSSHCISQGVCYPGLESCISSSNLPSRAVHAEANAIAQAAKYRISTNNSTIYVTLEPCISCLKLIISAGIKEVFYETEFNKVNNSLIRDMFIQEGLITLTKMNLSHEAMSRASLFLLNSTSVKNNNILTDA